MPRKMKPIEGSETSAFKPQTPGKYPKENILHNEHGESLKSRHTLIYAQTHESMYIFIKIDFWLLTSSCGEKCCVRYEHRQTDRNTHKQTNKQTNKNTKHGFTTLVFVTMTYPLKVFWVSVFQSVRNIYEYKYKYILELLCITGSLFARIIPKFPLNILIYMWIVAYKTGTLCW